MRKAHHNGGFSIIEMLTAIALLSVLTTIGVSALFQVTDGWKVSRNSMTLQDTAEYAFAELERDFGHVLSQQLAGMPVRGAERNHSVEEATSPFYRMTLEDDRIELPIQETDPATGAVVTQNVAYEISRQGETPALTRLVGPLGAEPPTASSNQWEYVFGLRIQYYDGETWQPKWEQDKLPEAVSVSMTIMDDVYPDEQIARRATFAIHVD